MKKPVKKLVIAILLGISIFSVGCGKSTNNVKETATKETVIKLDKDNAININYNNGDYKKIINLFNTNELQAKNKYLNKTVKITGEVSNIKKNDGLIIVSVMTNDNFYGAMFKFKDTKENEDKLINLKLYDATKGWDKAIRGDVITVYGYFKEYKGEQSVPDGERIQITNCELIK
ncbi:OB-fold putative lipoprotein [Clostridium estertheticum]|uniref:OB-fold putative lipoprotein n=1 Tax=Clostridium estertheticum TaxID=238834 RepID=UPI001C7D9657|nr:OB-fold putative lipoprotein [Clostridium estertheticum]MBX4267184.1 OB-fold putative lipoprotein [Clostridium estertheticum]WLC91306.1 OB-fold putative lipoprotein [Clostridium estertheticum]